MLKPTIRVINCKGEGMSRKEERSQMPPLS